MKNRIKRFFLNTSIQSVDCFRCASFDVFDTLIIRKCGKPTSIFDIVENEYNSIGISNLQNFKAFRIQAEFDLRKKNVEITLNEIYESLANKYGLKMSRMLKDLEVEAEYNQCVANLKISDFYNQYIENNEVYIISDMYLPSSIINEILTKNNITIPKKMYVSCEYGKTKRNRSLFEYVIKENMLKRRNIIHVGDNFVSDYLNPRLVGMHSCLIIE